MWRKRTCFFGGWGVTSYPYFPTWSMGFTPGCGGCVCLFVHEQQQLSPLNTKMFNHDWAPFSLKTQKGHVKITEENQHVNNTQMRWSQPNLHVCRARFTALRERLSVEGFNWLIMFTLKGYSMLGITVLWSNVKYLPRHLTAQLFNLANIRSFESGLPCNIRALEFIQINRNDHPSNRLFPSNDSVLFRRFHSTDNTTDWSGGEVAEKKSACLHTSGDQGNWLEEQFVYFNQKCQGDSILWLSNWVHQLTNAHRLLRRKGPLQRGCG